MGAVLVLVERSPSDGTVRRSTCALLTIARRLGTPVAVLCGAVDDAAADDDAAALLGRYGAEKVCIAAGPHAEDAFLATTRADVLVALARRMDPAAILITSGYVGQEVAARVAVRLDSGIIIDAVDVRLGSSGLTAVQVCLEASYLVVSDVVRGVPVITVRPEAAVPEAAPVEPVVERIDIEAETVAVPSVRLVSRVPRSSGRRSDLDAADVVVAGGRGVGSREAFELIGRVAEALGGAVGGSHTATELGWCPEDLQIGQTGYTVHPRLYLAGGISGSVRHRAGMQSSKTIVAVDADPAAPIFRIADFGVVGDVHQVLSALLEEIDRRRTQGSVVVGDHMET